MGPRRSRGRRRSARSRGSVISTASAGMGDPQEAGTSTAAPVDAGPDGGAGGCSQEGARMTDPIETALSLGAQRLAELNHKLESVERDNQSLRDELLHLRAENET